MPYRVEIGPQAESQLAELDAAIGTSVERKILWLAENASGIVHRRLAGMPKELGGLCKLRVGDYRILDWIYPREKRLRLYRIRHRSEVYRDL
jgi:mRNA-degrading endonuclease RelE of RelBE toxin-antitoxin system